jgi:branched-chain amino acid aminotransferase
MHRFEPKKPKNGSTWRLAPYTEQSKAPGKFSLLKSGNALLYVMAALFAEENQLDEALIVNTSGHIIESGTGNIFWKEKEQWFTPPLSDGCIAGIGRELFMESHQVQESHCSFNQLLEASCCVFTNAIYPYREFKPIQLD